MPIPLISLLVLTATLGNVISPSSNVAPHRTHLTIRRRFQFSSALKRMSTLSSLPNGKIIAAVKGAPETIKGMLDVVPENYDQTYKWFTRKGSRVLALGMKDMEPMNADKVRTPLNQLHMINVNFSRSTNFQETKSKANLFSRVSLSSIVLSRLMLLRLSKCLRTHLIG